MGSGWKGLRCKRGQLAHVQPGHSLQDKGRRWSRLQEVKACLQESSQQPQNMPRCITHACCAGVGLERLLQLLLQLCCLTAAAAAQCRADVN